MIDLSFATYYILGSLFFASLVFLISAGLNVIFGVLRIINLAHGSLYLLGSYVAYSLFIAFSSLDRILLSVTVPLLAGLIVGLVGIGLEYFMRTVYRLPIDYQLLFTFGLILIFADVMRMIWGVNPLTFGAVYFAYGTAPIGNLFFPLYNIFIIAVTLFVGLFLWYFLQRTRLGSVVRAVASEREMSSALGIDIKRVFIVTFLIGAFLGGLGGAVTVPVLPASPGADINILIIAFVAVVVGGLGSVKGAFVGALLLSALRTIILIVFPELELFSLYLFMVAVLLVRPYGLFGAKE
ncbi:MAG: branched-chain amino acid ABC transporter permease [Aigarchaeota archaeon]|nr:branched-chain amino acid ABC transporter permease [Aigarchaeota archaeon]MDW8092066.1 branched-chain amino acid ABC transporter permease [Nitrososphaerota archaeon]